MYSPSRWARGCWPQSEEHQGFMVQHTNTRFSSPLIAAHRSQGK